MQQDQITKILSQLADHETRLKQLEDGEHAAPAPRANIGGKEKTLREIVKGKKFKSGQEQIAVIVGYHERLLGQRIPKDKIKVEWAEAKLNGAFSPVYLSRAKGTLIRVLNDGTCDLTQTGEEFFDRLLNNESTNPTSK